MRKLHYRENGIENILSVRRDDNGYLDLTNPVCTVPSILTFYNLETIRELPLNHQFL